MYKPEWTGVSSSHLFDACHVLLVQQQSSYNSLPPPELLQHLLGNGQLLVAL